MPDPVVVTAEFVPKEGRLEQLREALRGAIPAVHEEAGCRLYAIHDAPDGRIVMIEKWDSAELLDAHASGEAVARLEDAVADLLAEPVKIVRLSPIPAGTPGQGEL
jgi:quinol monooxygenase YgiN